MNIITRIHKESDEDIKLSNTTSDEETADSNILHHVQEELRKKGNIIETAIILMFALILIILPLKTLIALLKITSNFIQKPRLKSMVCW